MASSRIKFGIDFQVNKAGLNELSKSLQDIQVQARNLRMTGNITQEFANASKSAHELNNILNSSWNDKLGQLDLSKFNQQMKASGKSFQEYYATLLKADPQGKAAFEQVQSAIANTNLQIKTSNKLLDGMAATFKRTVQYGISTKVMNTITGSIQKAWTFSKNLDKSLNDIRIVTGKSAEEMDKFAVKANKAAQSLASNTVEYTKASLIYYQQGLSDEDVAARTDTTIKTANVTGQSAQTVSEELTAVWNGYKVSSAEAEKYVDKLSAVAATTASDLGELANGMSKVASAANSMGVDVDQLNATLSTVISVTRQAPESVGTAFKTIYARMGDIEAGTDGETTLGDYTAKVKEIAGINVLGTNGQLRDMGEVIEEVGNKWTDLSREQQVALSQAMAGTRQYNNLLALFDNWYMYEKSLDTSQNSLGALQAQQNTYLESTQAHLDKLQATSEELYLDLFNSDMFKGLIDGVTLLASTFDKFVKSLGGGAQSLASLGAIGVAVFNKQLSKGLNNYISNQKIAKSNAEAFKVELESIQGALAEAEASGQYAENDPYINKLKNEEALLKVAQDLTTEEYERLQALKDEIYQQELLVQQYKEAVDAAEGPVTSMEVDDEEKTYKDTEQGQKAAWEDANKVALEATEQQVGAQARLNKLKEIQAKIVHNIPLDERELKQLLDNKIISEEEYKNKIQGTIKIQNQLTDEIANAEKRTEELKQTQAEYNELAEQAKNAYITRKYTKQQVDQMENNVKTNEGAFHNGSTDKDGNHQRGIDDAERQKRTSEALKGIAAITLSINLLTNAFNVLSDESMSAGEKVKQLFSMLLMQLPMIVPMIGSIGTAFEVVKLKVDELTAHMLANPIIAIIMGIAAAIIAIGVAVYMTATKEERAYQQAVEAANKAKEAANEAQQAYEELASSFKSFQDGVDALNDLTKSTDEYKEALEESNKKAKELIANNAELRKYAYNENGVIKFKEGAEQYIESEGHEAAMVQGAAYAAEIDVNNKDYDNTIDDTAWDYGMSTDTLDYIATAINSFGDLQPTIEELSAETGYSVDYLEGLYNSSGTIESDILDIAEKQKARDEDNTALLKNMVDIAMEQTAGYSDLTAAEQASAKFLAESSLSEDEYNKIADKIHDEVWNGKYKDGAFGGGGEDELHKKYAEYMGYDVNNIEDNMWDTATFYQDGKKVAEDVDDDAQRRYVEQRMVQEAVEEATKTNNEEIIKLLPQITAMGEVIGEGIGDELVGLVTGSDTTLDLDSFSIGNFNKLKDAYESGNLESYLTDTLSDKEIEQLGGIDEIKSRIGDVLTEENRQAILDAAQESLEKLRSTFSKLQDEVYSGKLTADNAKDNESYTAIVAQLENIKTLYPEITTSAKIFGNTALIGTQEWYEALEDVQDAINKSALTKKAQDFQDAWEEAFGENGITVNTNLEDAEFQSDLESILNADYAINIEIHTQAENAFDETQSAMENIKEQAEKIGENFVVSAEDVRELNNAFPGILQNVINLKDGTVRLDQAAVKSAMDASKAEVLADLEASNEKLKNSANELRAKQANYQSMADTAKLLAKGEITSEEEVEKLKSQLRDGLNTLNEESTNADLTNQTLIAESSSDNAKAMASNWANAYQSAADNASEFAKVAVSAHKSAESGKNQVEKGDFGVNYQSQGGVSSEASQVEEYQELLDNTTTNAQEAYAKIAEMFQEAADAAGKSANDIEGMIYENTVYMEGVVDSLDGIASGAGADGIKEIIDLLEDEFDIYHDINIEIQKLDNNLSKLQKKQEKLLGQDLMDNLNEQLDTLNKQNAAYEEKLALMNKEQVALQAYLSSQGVSFNSDGTIGNYNDILNQYQDQINSWRKEANSMDSDSATRKQLEQDTEQLEKRFEKLQDKLSRYDTLVFTEMNEVEEKIQDAMDQKIEIEISKFTAKVQVTLDLSKAEKEWYDFKTKTLDGLKEDDYFGKAKNDLATFMSYYNTAGTGTGPIQKLTEQLNGTIEQLRQIEETGTSSVYGNNQTKALEDLQTYYKEMMTQLSDVKEVEEAIKKDYLDTIEKVADAFDEQVKQYEQVDKLIQHDKELIGLVYGDTAYGAFAQYFEEMRKNDNANLEMLKLRTAYYKEQMEKATDDDIRQKWLEKWQDSLNDLNEAVEKAVKNLDEQYSNEIDRIIDDIQKKITNGKGIEAVKEQWDLMKKESELFLDEVDRAYDIDALERKYNKSIQESSSVATQRKLNALKDEELKKLKEANKLTQYDVDRANKVYELELKRIALQEAQQNKSQMRLRRDSQGNYSYQFVADQDEISKAQEDIAKAEQDLYDFDRDAYKDKLNQIYELETEFLEKYKQIQMDKSLSDEERDEKLRNLESTYGSWIDDLSDRIHQNQRNLYDDTENYIEEKYNINREQFEAMSQAEQAELMGNLVPQWQSGIQDMVNTFVGNGGFIPTCEEGLEELHQTTEDYENKLDELQQSAGVDFENIKNGIDENVDATQRLIDRNQDLIDKYAAEVTQMNAVLSKLNEVKSGYDNVTTAAETALIAAQKLWSFVTGQDFSTNTPATTLTEALGNFISGAQQTFSKTDNNNNNNSNNNNNDNNNNNNNNNNDNTSSDTIVKLKSSDPAISVASGIRFDSRGNKSSIDLSSIIGANAKLLNTNEKTGMSTIQFADGNVVEVKSSNLQTTSEELGNSTINYILSKPTHIIYYKTYTVGSGSNQTKYIEFYSQHDSKTSLGKGVYLEQLSTEQMFEKYSKNHYKPYTKNFKEFRTGGYTGSWNSDEGRLAVLHQKELILNKEDTSNILTAVNTVRNMEGLLSSLGNAVSNRTNGLLGLLGNSFGMTSVAKEQFEQNVHIDANFPNVTDRFEIENAFENLVNLASMEALKS